jgi:hypothetical protein
MSLFTKNRKRIRKQQEQVKIRYDENIIMVASALEEITNMAPEQLEECTKPYEWDFKVEEES